MSRNWSFMLSLAASLGSSLLVVAQPPSGPGVGGPGAGPGGPGGGAGERRTSPIIEALDADHDHNISAEEIKDAVVALLTLDKNKDGQLSPDEYRPAGAGGPGAGGPGAGGPGAGGPGAGGPGAGGPGGPGAGGRQGGGPGGRQGGPGGRQGGPGAGGPGGREQGPPPVEHDPEQFVRHAMEFDADGDGKLNREELLKFAAQMPPPPQGGPGGPGAGGPGGGRGPRGGGPGAGGPGGGQPARPTRPASDE